MLVLGLFIILEAIASVVLSQDQRWFSTIGRVLRIGAGILIIVMPVK